MRNNQPFHLVPSHDADDTILSVYCATCGADMGVKPGYGTHGISHGICDPCFDQAMRDLDNWRPTVLHDPHKPTTEN